MANQPWFGSIPFNPLLPGLLDWRARTPPPPPPSSPLPTYPGPVLSSDNRSWIQQLQDRIATMRAEQDMARQRVAAAHPDAVDLMAFANAARDARANFDAGNPIAGISNLFSGTVDQAVALGILGGATVPGLNNDHQQALETQIRANSPDYTILRQGLSQGFQNPEAGRLAADHWARWGAAGFGDIFGRQQAANPAPGTSSYASPIEPPTLMLPTGPSRFDRALDRLPMIPPIVAMTGVGGGGAPVPGRAVPYNRSLIPLHKQQEMVTDAIDAARARTGRTGAYPPWVTQKDQFDRYAAHYGLPTLIRMARSGRFVDEPVQTEYLGQIQPSGQPTDQPVGIPLPRKSILPTSQRQLSGLPHNDPERNTAQRVRNFPGAPGTQFIPGAPLPVTQTYDSHKGRVTEITGLHYPQHDDFTAESIWGAMDALLSPEAAQDALSRPGIQRQYLIDLELAGRARRGAVPTTSKNYEELHTDPDMNTEGTNNGGARSWVDDLDILYKRSQRPNPSGFSMLSIEGTAEPTTYSHPVEQSWIRRNVRLDHPAHIGGQYGLASLADATQYANLHPNPPVTSGSNFGGHSSLRRPLVPPQTDEAAVELHQQALDIFRNNRQLEAASNELFNQGMRLAMFANPGVSPAKLRTQAMDFMEGTTKLAGFSDLNQAFTPKYGGHDVPMPDLNDMPHNADLVSGETYPETKPIDILNRPRTFFKPDPSKSPAENKAARAAFDAKQVEQEQKLRAFIETVQSAQTVAATAEGPMAYFAAQRERGFAIPMPSHPDELVKELTYSTTGPDGKVIENKVYMTLPEHTDLLKAYGVLPEAPTHGFKPLPQSRAQITDKMYTPSLLRAEPDALFVFGDNLQRTGKGGQAIIRDEPNAIGVPTKYAPNKGSTAYFGRPDNEQAEKAAIDAAFDKILSAVRSGKRVYFPAGGLGTGLAELDTRAPALLEHINNRIQEILNFDRPEPLQRTELNVLNVSATEDEDPNTRTATSELPDPGHFGQWMQDKDFEHIPEESPIDTYLGRMYDPDKRRYVRVEFPTRESARDHMLERFKEVLASTTPMIEKGPQRYSDGTPVVDKNGHIILTEVPTISKYDGKPQMRPIGAEPVWSVTAPNEDAGSSRKNKSWQRSTQRFGNTDVYDAIYLYDPELIKSTIIPLPRRNRTNWELVRKDVRDLVRNGQIVSLEDPIDPEQQQAFSYIALTKEGLEVNKYIGKTQNARDIAKDLYRTLLRNGVSEEKAESIGKYFISNRTLPGLITTLFNTMYVPNIGIEDENTPADKLRTARAFRAVDVGAMASQPARQLPMRAIIDAINVVSVKANGTALGTDALFSLKTQDGNPIVGGYGANLDYTLPIQFTAGHGFKGGGNIQPNNRLYFRLKPGAIPDIPSSSPLKKSTDKPAQPTTPKPAAQPTTNVWYGAGENKVLSNLAERPFTFTFNGREVLFRSVEHAYQTLKSGVFDKNIYNLYMKHDSVNGLKIRGPITDNGSAIQLMEALMRASFDQNPTARAALDATGNSRLTHTQDTGIWRNEFPRILTDIRNSPAPSQTPTDIRVKRVISGGQTGADIAGVEAAKELGLETGGWLPKGWRTQDGARPEYRDQYGMSEHPDDSYTGRTMQNVDDADATIAFRFKYSTGTDKTIGYAQTGKWQNGSPRTTYLGKRPVLVITDPKNPQLAVQQIREFLTKTGAQTINIAGHRESSSEGINAFVRAVLTEALKK